MKLVLLLGITLTPALVILPAPRAARDHQKASGRRWAPRRASCKRRKSMLEEQWEFLRHMTRGGECYKR